MTWSKQAAAPAALPYGANAALLFIEGQYALQLADAGKGEPQTLKMLAPASVRAAFSKIPVDSGWLPPRLRRWGYGEQGEYAVLYVPPQAHPLRLINDFGERFGKKRSLRLTVPLPGLVFAGQGSGYAVWAAPGDDFNPAAAACRAPLPNVHANGTICFGPNRPPACAPGAIEAAWQLFIATPFNGHLKDGSSRAHAHDCREVLLALAEAEATAYPVEDLVRGGGTLDNVVTRFIGEAENGAHAIDEDEWFDDEGEAV